MMRAPFLGRAVKKKKKEFLSQEEAKGKKRN
jgi:hypothetical protein